MRARWGVLATILLAGSALASTKSGGGGGGGGGGHGGSPVRGSAHGGAPVGVRGGGYGPGYRGGYGYAGRYNYAAPYRGYGFGLNYRPWGWGWNRPWGWGYGYGYAPYGYGVPVGGVGVAASAYAEPPPEPSVRVSAGAVGQLFQGGGALGLNLAVEGPDLGLVADLNNLVLPAADGSYDFNALRLLNVNATYALLSGPNGRLRLEAGVASAMEPGAILVAPGFGVSGVIGLAGPLGVEASVRGAFWPYQQLDGMAGLALGLGPIGLRGGWRYTYVNDEGRATGTAQAETMSGPYVGLSLSI